MGFYNTKINWLNGLQWPAGYCSGITECCFPETWKLKNIFLVDYLSEGSASCNEEEFTNEPVLERIKTPYYITLIKYDDLFDLLSLIYLYTFFSVVATDQILA